MKIHPLKRYREQRGVAMKDAAAALRISQATVSRIEAGKLEPSHDVMRRIAQWTKGSVTPNDLVIQ